jgi:hypothetical protein
MVVLRHLERGGPALSNVIQFPRPKVELPVRMRKEFWAFKRDGAKITKEYASRFEMLLNDVLKAQITAATTR